MELLELVCDVDDFCQEFWPQWHQHLLDAGIKEGTRKPQLSESEIMTILIRRRSLNQIDDIWYLWYEGCNQYDNIWCDTQ